MSLKLSELLSRPDGNPDNKRTYVVPPGWHKRYRSRLAICMVFFVFAYMVVVLRVAYVTVIHPIKPAAAWLAAVLPHPNMSAPLPDRASILDDKGRLLAVSLPDAALYADPKQIVHPREVARQLAALLPDISLHQTELRLSLKRSKFAYIDRALTPGQEMAVNRLGVPGLYFLPGWARHYPNGSIAAHILGGVTPGQNGLAGIEESFNKRLLEHPAIPLKLSIDVRVQDIVQRELSRAMHDYDARGACAIVENMTGRIVAMVSLPDYNANDFHDAPPDAQINRCISGDYEPGSVMKLMTLASALQSGLVHVWDRFNTTHPLFVGGYAVTDYEPVHHWLAVPAILAYSSNIGASRIATILGPKLQRAWLRKMGFFNRTPIRLPGAQYGLWHARSAWRLLTTMSVSFGNGIAMPPLTLVNAIVADLNGGILYRPSLLAPQPGAPPRQGIRVMRPDVSVDMRKMMRSVVLFGTGVYANVPGYLVGGKTGTSQVVGANGRYKSKLNNSSFVAAFPINAPRYVVYALVIHPKPTKKMQNFSHGFTTGGYVAAPAVGRIISRIGPMLGVRPLSGPALKAANAKWHFPLAPKPPRSVIALGPSHPFPQGANQYAYDLAHEPGPKHPDRAARLAALKNVSQAVPFRPVPHELRVASSLTAPAETRPYQGSILRPAFRGT